MRVYSAKPTRYSNSKLPGVAQAPGVNEFDLVGSSNAARGIVTHCGHNINEVHMNPR